MALEFKMFVAGRWIGDSDEKIPVINPADEACLGFVPVAGPAHLEEAVVAVSRGFRAWSRAGARERCRILARAGRMIRERKDQLARRLTLEQGKPLAEAGMEVDDTADWFEWYAEEAKRSYGRILPGLEPGGGRDVLVFKEPVGVVAIFSPWNFPISEPCAHLSAALAAGCTAIVKPSEETPGTMCAVLEACFEAGVPKDAVNLVYGRPAMISEFLIAAEPVRKISFTGSIPVGKRLASLAASRMKKFTMELGGNAPAIVCSDADPASAARLIAGKKYRNAGQVCTAPNRIYVHDAVHDAFVSELTAIAGGLRLGDGLLAETEMGPLVSSGRLKAMEAFVGDAEAKGATVHTGGARLNRKGFFWQPTVMSGVPDDARVMREEIFGPIAAISRFKEIEDVTYRANDVEAGLASYIFGRSMADIWNIVREIKTGLVGVNNTTVALAEAPFGGMKDSGHGRIGGSEGLDAYVEVKTVTLSTIP